MSKVMKRGGVILSLLATLALFAGCSSKEDPKKTADGKTQKDDDQKDQQAKKDKDETGAHSGWWCDEHGIPELECSMCQAKVEKECKAKGDWCEKHNRAKSQCFICDPNSKLKAKYAADYRVRYGKEPPAIKE